MSRIAVRTVWRWMGVFLVVALSAAGEVTMPEIAFTIWDWTAPARDIALFETWAADAASMGVNRIELSTPWPVLEVAPGEYDLSFIADRLAVCKRHGLGMRLRLGSYYAGQIPDWYEGDRWMDFEGAVVLGGGLPSLCDDRFWRHFGPLCTEIARAFKGEDLLYSPFIGVHAEMKFADWWSYDPATLACWRDAIAAPRPDWLGVVVADDVPLPERPPVPAETRGRPDPDPVSRAWIAFREEVWRQAMARFCSALRAGDPEARVSAPLGESYRRQSAHMANLDYWGLTRGANQVVHSYDFFWHAQEPAWLMAASIKAFQGITGLPVVVELDGPNLLTDHGYTPFDLLALCRKVHLEGAGINIANWSYTGALPSSHPLLRDICRLFQRPAAARMTAREDTVLLFVSKWANYAYRERSEWLHDAQFGVYRILDELGIPVRFICEDNLEEDLSGYHALYVAFSPPELMPEEAWQRLEALNLPMIIDTPFAPEPYTGRAIEYAEGPAGRVCVVGPFSPVQPCALTNEDGEPGLEWEGHPLARYRPGRVTLGYAPGLIHRRGPDPRAQEGLVLWAILRAERR